MTSSQHRLSTIEEMSQFRMNERSPGPVPIALPVNQPRQFYRGGHSIAALRGQENVDIEFGPEDWVASTTTRFGSDTVGLSTLPNGQLLRDAIRADPLGWLGESHVEAFGSNPALLVKLLDAGQRLPVHCHPSNSFAQQHFHSDFGKTEAWLVVGTTGERPMVYAGFREDVDESTVTDWVTKQNSADMLGALNEIAVKPGDSVFIPAGLPHSISAGIFLVELQQPTDLSVTLEWKGFLDSANSGHLGIGYQTALGCLDRSAWSTEKLSTIIHSVDDTNTDAASAIDVLGDKASEFFRAERLSIRPGTESTASELADGFSVLIMLTGKATLRTEHAGELAVAAGDTVVIPHHAGVSTVDGSATAIRCRPPQPHTRSAPPAKGAQ